MVIHCYVVVESIFIETSLITPVSSIVTYVYFTDAVDVVEAEFDTVKNGEPFTVINPLFFKIKKSQYEFVVFG
jgi:hypothetical protein